MSGGAHNWLPGAPGLYRSRWSHEGPGPVVLAAVIALLIVIGSHMAAAAIEAALSGGDASLAAAPHRLMRATLLAQALMVAATIGAAQMLHRGPPGDLLRWRIPAGGRSDILRAALVLVIIMAVLNGVLVAVGIDILADLALFRQLLNSEHWLLAAVAIVVGAPVAEELLFRGFLLAALARTRLGFSGAALLTTLAWASLHLRYSAVALAEVALAGLILSWLLWRTDSLLAPIAAHAAYNALAVVVMWAAGPP